MLVEQIYGNYDLFRLYEVSFKTFENCIYFFKRQRTAENKSYLQLYKYDLNSNQEELLAKYKIEEPESVQYNVIFGEEFGTDKKKNFLNETDFIESQYVTL